MTPRIPFHDDETVEDLRAGGLRLIQKKDGFRFGEDSVFLAAFAADAAARAAQPVRGPRAAGPARIADLGCGCGAVSILLARRLPDARIAGLELVPRIAFAAARNAALNGLSDRLAFAAGDLRSLAEPAGPAAVLGDLFPRHSFDLVVSNPPYRRATTPPDADGAGPSELVLAREEAAATLDDVLAAAAALLRPRGRLALAYAPERLPDLMEALRRRRLEPETLRLVLPDASRAPSCLLATAVANGRPGGFRLLAPLVVRDAAGAHTPEAAAVYGDEAPLSPEALRADLRPAGPDPLSRRAAHGG